MEPSPGEIANLTRAVKGLRAAPITWEPVLTGGHTPAHRWIVGLNDARSVFAKVAVDELTASWLRDEHLAYSLLRGAPFMPGYVGWHDDGERPVLVLEDLSHGSWPPPWERSRVDAVLATLHALASTRAPQGLPRVADEHLGLRRWWGEIERDPTVVERLGLSSVVWLAEALPMLREAAEAAPLDGEALLHLDVRSDNVCLRDGRALFVDWNWTCVGNPLLDVALWLPSLQAEGGPAPEEVLDPRIDGVAGFAAAYAGYLVSHAGLEPIPNAPHVRRTQLAQARTALPWAARALGLPPPS